MTTSLSIRQPCPPGACICEREPLLETPGADLRILSLTRSEEKRLIERLENLQSLGDLERLQRRMYEQLDEGPRDGCASDIGIVRRGAGRHGKGEIGRARKAMTSK